MLDAIDQPFLVFTFGLAPDADAHAAVDGHVAAVLGALGPWDSGRRYLNFAESRDGSAVDLPDRVVRPVRARKARYDPTGIFVANHAIARDGAPA